MGVSLLNNSIFSHYCLLKKGLVKNFSYLRDGASWFIAKWKMDFFFIIVFCGCLYKSLQTVIITPPERRGNKQATLSFIDM